MLLVPAGTNQFQWRLSAHGLATRPAAAMGVAVTPGNNTKGAYATLIASGNLINDVYGVTVHVNSNAVSAAARNTLVDIGVDPAGGTAFSVVIPDLLASCAASGQGGGVWYYFPLWIPAGSSIGARAQVNNATVGTLRVNVRVRGRPTRPELVKVGSRVTAYGVTPATSQGTTVTAGTTAEGAWTTLATAIAQRNWWWQLGMGVNDATMAALLYHADLGVGDATNKNVVIENMAVRTTAAEELSLEHSETEGLEDIPAGVNVYGRLQCSGTADSALSLACYGLGD